MTKDVCWKLMTGFEIVDLKTIFLLVINKVSSLAQVS